MAVFTLSRREEVQVSLCHYKPSSDFASDTLMHLLSSTEESYDVPLDEAHLGWHESLHFDETLSVFGLEFKQSAQQSRTRGVWQPEISHVPHGITPKPPLLLFLLVNYSEIPYR